MSATLSAKEVEDAAGGYKRAGDQLRILKERGFYRAFRSPVTGEVVLERPHYDAVSNAAQVSGPVADIPPPRPFAETPLGRWQAEQRQYYSPKETRPPQSPEAKAARAEARRLKQRIARALATSGRRRAAEIRQAPAWADSDAVRAIYAEAQRLTRETGIAHHVDHAVPLQGKLVSGLHVPANLQILTASENARKSNRYEIEA